jgi:hypothetical protein
MALHNYLRINVHGHADNGTEAATKLVYSTFDFMRTASTGTPSKTAALTAFLAGPFATYLLAASVNYIVDNFQVAWLDDWTDPYVRSNSTLTGAVAGDSLPSNVSVCCRKTTAFRGKYACRGSFKFGPVAESNSTLDGLSATGITLYTAACNAILAGFTSADSWTYVPVIISRKASQLKIPTNPAIVPQPLVVVGPISIVSNLVTGIAPNLILGSMKRRKQPQPA